MFCKWCGGNLTSYDTKCKRCGREVPALSDCGGFYDLVSNVKKPVEVQPVLAPAPTPTPTLAPVSKRKKTNVKRILIGLITLTVALGLAIALLFLVVALCKTNQSATETEVVSDHVLEEEHVLFDIVIKGDNSEKHVIDEAIIALSNDPETTVKWQYRFGEKSDWSDFPDDAFIQTDNAEKLSLNIKETWLQELIETNKEEEQLELRCEINRINPDGSSMTVTIEGIRFS